MPGRAQRNTLTFSQMYGGMTHAGMMEGKGIFSKLGKLIVRGAKKLGKIIKKEKLLSKGLALAGTAVGAIPGVPSKAAGLGLKIAAEVAKQRGFGLHTKVKSLSRNQIESILRGLATRLTSGGISMAAAKILFPKIKNITPMQMKALAMFRGRHMKGGGISLSGGRATGMTGMGFSGMGMNGGRIGRPRTGRPRKGIVLAGQGLRLAGAGELLHVRKNIVRRRPRTGTVRRVTV